MPDLKREQQMNNALELFYYGFRAFTAKPDRILEQRGLQRVHHRILYFVARQPGLSVSELLHILGVSKQALHAPLRQLIEMRLVDSQPGTHDKRLRQLRLTADGNRLEHALSAAQHKLLEQVFTQMGPGGEQQWRAVMRAVALTEFALRDDLI